MEAVGCDGDGCFRKSRTSLSLLTRILTNVAAGKTICAVKSVLQASC
jgi:hypothetical protein